MLVASGMYLKPRFFITKIKRVQDNFNDLPGKEGVNMSGWQNYMEEHREQYVGELTEFLRIPIYTPACMGGLCRTRFMP